MNSSSKIKNVGLEHTFRLLHPLHIFMLIAISMIAFTGCATTGTSQTQLTSQVITVKENLVVHLYNSLTELQAAYLYNGGDISIAKRVKGFYSDRNNSMHCMKWDFYTCGHELFHALQYKGDTTLFVEQGYEHFKEHNYASE